MAAQPAFHRAGTNGARSIRQPHTIVIKSYTILIDFSVRICYYEIQIAGNAAIHTNNDQETENMSEMKEKLHTGELYLPGDEAIMKEQMVYC